MKNIFFVVTCMLLIITNIFLSIVLHKCHVESVNNETLIKRYQEYIVDFQTCNIDVGDEALCHEIFKDTQDERIIIYRFFKERCGKCVESELCMLKEAEKKYGFKVFILHPEPLSREEDILNKNILGELSYKYVNQDEFSIENISCNNHRYYAILEKSGIITNIFFPDSKLPELMDAYFIKTMEVLK